MMDDLRKHAAERHNAHKRHASSRPLSEDYELVGLAGEQAFADAFGCRVDMEVRPGGDGGRDFTVNGFTIDIKTARKAYNLLREANKRHADILVLARYCDDTQAAVLVGWEYDTALQRQPTKDFGYGIVNHYLPKRALRSIESLHSVLQS